MRDFESRAWDGLAFFGGRVEVGPFCCWQGRRHLADLGMRKSLMVVGALFCGLGQVTGAEKLFVAKPLTPAGSFTDAIEGPAVDAEGSIYAVSYAGDKQHIGKVTAAGAHELFLKLPGASTGNGIRFDPEGNLLVADYVEHKVLRIHPETRAVTVLAHEPSMNQPNDLARHPGGWLYASDPNWKAGTGQLWRITMKGEVTRVAADMGTTNGIDVSPDGKRLYVNESKQRKVWVFSIEADGSLKEKRLLKEFTDFGFDGMRCDAGGALYITRHGKGTVVKLSPAGEVLREIAVGGSNPSNLCFGGPDGRTVYVTEMERGRLMQFRVDHPGREWRGAGR
jgi:gluconolactonase